MLAILFSGKIPVMKSNSITNTMKRTKASLSSAQTLTNGSTNTATCTRKSCKIPNTSVNTPSSVNSIKNVKLFWVG